MDTTIQLCMLTSEEVISPKIEMNPKQKPSYYVNIH